MCDVESITKIAKCLNVTPGQLGYNKEQVVTRTIKNVTVSGYTTILAALAKESNSDIAKSSNESLELQCQVQQWIDYAVLYVAPASKDKHVAQTLLKELDSYLLTRSYFVGYAVTLADLAVFYAIYDLMKALTSVDKESYINLSRWFDHLQKNDDIRQGDELLNFATIYLHGWATGTHI